MAKDNSNPISNLETTFAKPPSIPIAPKYLVSNAAIPITGEGYNLAKADKINKAETSILIPQTSCLFDLLFMILFLKLIQL